MKIKNYYGRSGAAKPKREERGAEKPSGAQEKPAVDDGELEKGKPVKLPDGRTGKIAYLDPGMRIARVKLDAGGHETVKQKALTVMPYVQVAAHIRRIAEK